MNDNTFSNERDAEPDLSLSEEDSYIDVSEASTAYVSGYVARRVFKEGGCNVCESLLLTKEPIPYVHSLIEFKEYSSDVQRLIYPSEALIKSVSQGANTVESMLDDHLEMTAVQQTIVASIFNKVDFEWLNVENDCESECGILLGHSIHVHALKVKICQEICRVCIPWYMKIKSRELKWGD